MTKRKTSTLIYVVAACTIAVSGLITLLNTTQSADPEPHTSSSEAAAALENLPVKGRAPKTGYDRELKFGAAWADADQNGCDTRNDILARDLIDVTLSGDCKVVAGMLEDPFTGSTIEFVRGQATSAAVQIDHLVALSDAWQKGAQQLTQEERIAFANDPMNLQAVSGKANAQKGDSDAACACVLLG